MPSRAGGSADRAGGMEQLNRLGVPDADDAVLAVCLWFSVCCCCQSTARPQQWHRGNEKSTALSPAGAPAFTLTAALCLAAILTRYLHAVSPPAPLVALSSGIGTITSGLSTRPLARLPKHEAPAFNCPGGCCGCSGSGLALQAAGQERSGSGGTGALRQPLEARGLQL